MSSDPTGTEVVDRIAEAVLAVPGVSGLHAGVLGEAATYLPGRRVNGIKVKDDSCEVHVIVDWNAPIRQTADDVRAAVEPLVEGPVHISVEDVATQEPTPTSPENHPPKELT